MYPLIETRPARAQRSALRFPRFKQGHIKGLQTSWPKVLVPVQLFEDVSSPEKVVVICCKGTNIRVGAIVDFRVITTPIHITQVKNWFSLSIFLLKYCTA